MGDATPRGTLKLSDETKLRIYAVSNGDDRDPSSMPFATIRGVCRVLDGLRGERDAAIAERDEALDRIDGLNQRHEEDEAYRQATIAERDEARAALSGEPARIAAAVAEALADVAAWLRTTTHAGGRLIAILASGTVARLADDIDQGAHVGAATGGER